MTKNEETILNNLVKTLQDCENECFRAIAYMNEHKFEIEREAVRYKQQAFNHSWLEVANAIDEIKGLKKIEQTPTWSEEDERIHQCLIRDQEKSLDDVRNDKYGHSEIISDLKEMYRERINWIESIKERLKGE